ncbi:MAG TPA: hypothetical protein VF178_10075 [Gemmatimonadaceae bacterium]
MTAFYWFAFVVGTGMVLFSLLADHGDGGHGVDAHADAVDHAGDGFKILSLRNATYFLFAFGVSGVLLTWLWGGSRSLLTAAVALGCGVAGGTLSRLIFGWLKRSESGQLPDDSSWIGATGHVTLPLSSEGTGKVLVTRGQRELELLARPFDEAAHEPERWTSIMVVEMRQGVALVAPADPSLGNTDPVRLSSNQENW